MPTKKIFGLNVKLIKKPRQGRHIFTTFYGSVCIVESTINILTNPTLEFAIKHEEYHKRTNKKFISGCLLSVFIVFLIIYTQISNITLVSRLCLLLIVSLLLAFLLFLASSRIMEKKADKYAVKKLNKKIAKAAILELYEKGIIKEDRSHGSINSRLSYIDSIK